jgi:hypothetical protein
MRAFRPIDRPNLKIQNTNVNKYSEVRLKAVIVVSHILATSIDPGLATAIALAFTTVVDLARPSTKLSTRLYQLHVFP